MHSRNKVEHAFNVYVRLLEGVLSAGPIMLRLFWGKETHLLMSSDLFGCSSTEAQAAVEERWVCPAQDLQRPAGVGGMSPWKQGRERKLHPHTVLQTSATSGSRSSVSITHGWEAHYSVTWGGSTLRHQQR